MTIEKLQTFSAAHGLGPPPKETGVNYIVETKTFGRWGYKVETKSGFVKSVAYNFAS